MSQFKAIQYLVALTIFSSFSTFASIRRLTPTEISNYSTKMIQLHPPTSSASNSATPDITAQKGKFLIAKMDSFGLDRYFTFSTNDHVKELHQAVQNGGSMFVEWYYLNPEDTICITSFDEWQESSQPARAQTVESTSECDISGLDKILIVRALWKQSQVAPAAQRFTPDLANRTEISDEDIQTALNTGFIDYLNCRVMKVDLRSDAFNTRSYNKNNGAHAAEKIIAELRKK